MTIVTYNIAGQKCSFSKIINPKFNTKFIARLNYLLIKRKRSIFLSILFIFLSSIAFCQTNSIELSLVKNYGNGPFNGSVYMSTRLDSASIARKFPVFVTDYIIKHFSLKVNKQKEINFYFLVGKSISGDTVLVYDKNHDFDFTNDSIIYYNIPNKASSNDISINLDYSDNGPRFFTIRPILYKTNRTYGNSAEQEKYLMISPFEHLKGDFTYNKINYSIYVYPYNGSPDYKNDNGSQFLIGNKDTLIELKMGEPQKIDYIVIKPISIDKFGKKLTLNIDKYEQAQHLIGNNKDFKLPKAYLTDIMNNKCAIPIKNKYTLLDFWGTWCSPCKELTPELKKISDNKTNKLEIISIATYEKERVNVLKYIEDNKMNWQHVILNDKNTKPTTNLYKINEFPTFILINEEGIVVDRYIGPDGFKRLKIKLNELKLSR